MKAYTLKEDKDSGELHLFEGDMYPKGSEYKCNSGSKSICKKMNTTNNKGNRFSCATEQEAREEIAKIGRKVCGTCVSHLYTSY
ncbi:MULTISPECIES: hypothetical protein [Pectobacterium]|uniref:Uncharacterized protein n=1 Tax=Pectobacterium aquaticum TaxID=2204145 RepID=A0A426JE39_9GAMM|nr:MULTISPECIES: hypothetical protein [Pectobacterium]MBN3238276.1 hypothetical protein [Pectobacterium versatile]MBQ4778176.1 hypothetical protein [Pectobacterium versatile]PVY71175.1 hypothetical protein C7330_0131 [Pectobacterium versatile]RRO11423.1 hypothetical protein DMB85_003725 [Pectobacterium aquaticum]